MTIQPIVFRTVATILIASGSSRAQVSFSGIGHLAGGEFISVASGVSADGQVVVGRNGGSMASHRAVFWTHATRLQPVVLPTGWEAPGSWAWGVSADGAVIAGTAKGVTYSMFRWSAASGSVALGGIPGSLQYSEAQSISADGNTIIGISQAFNPNVGEYETVPIRWTPSGGAEPLGWLPDMAYGLATAVSASGNVILGCGFGGGGPGSAYGRATIWQPSSGLRELGPVPVGARGWIPRAVSADGEIIVGTVVNQANHSFPFLWKSTGMTFPTPIPGAENTYLYGISADGGAAVGRMFGPGATGAILWTAELGIQRITTFLATRYGFSLPSGWIMDGANAISGDGRTIVGSGRNPAGQTEGWVLHLPAPLSCFANCDYSTFPPVLTVTDFVCFLNRFTEGDPYVNCDQSTVSPLLNVADFICFLNRYAAGCP